MQKENLSFRRDLPKYVGGKRSSGHLIAPPEHSDFVLRRVMHLLDQSPGTLFRLLGRSPTNSGHWFSMGQSPSQFYWVRIAHLLTLALEGVNLKRVRTVHWDTVPFTIEWWPGAEPVTEGTTIDSEGIDVERNAWGDIPTPDGDNHGGGAGGPEKSPFL